ncbi:MAG TPA: archaeosine biosynthesis radical SAM protein RaSEA [Thermoplasmata archaeon]|nr:archaeosine biosynthesis radical SAM protein RaSEA [Thermoplasmata archaeon]
MSVSLPPVRRAVLKHRFYPEDRATYPIVWREEESFEGERIQAMVAILKTRGCAWDLAGGCTMCSYTNQSHRGKFDQADLEAQVDRLAANYQGEKVVKIYTSGSFLDEREVPKAVRDIVLAKVGAAKKLIVEARADVTPEHVLEDLAAQAPQTEIALGLESASQTILDESVNKGGRVEDFVDAAKRIHARGLRVKAYVMLKPPFLSERMALADAASTLEFAAPHSDTLSLNPVNIHKGSLVERLFYRGEYRPPWIWSVWEAISGRPKGKLTICSTVAFGKRRGAHNCGKCDGELTKALKEFNFRQELPAAPPVECVCREAWRETLAYEGILGGAPLRR